MDDKDKLISKLERSLLDRIAVAGTREGGPTLLDAIQLKDLTAFEYYLSVEHNFQAGETEALLQFTDPLTVAMECWKDRAPEKGFPICALLHEIRAYERFELVDPARYTRQSAEQLQSLKDRVDQNMSDFQAKLYSMDKAEIIARSAKIAAMQEAYAFIKEDHNFTSAEVFVLLGMENPLEFVANQWPSDIDWLPDMALQISASIIEASRKTAVQQKAEPTTPEQKQAISSEVEATLQMLVDSDLELYGEVTGDTFEAIQAQGYKLQEVILQRTDLARYGLVQSGQETAVVPNSAKPSVRGQLQAKMWEAGQRPPPTEHPKGGEAR